MKSRKDEYHEDYSPDERRFFESKFLPQLEVACASAKAQVDAISAIIAYEASNEARAAAKAAKLAHLDGKMQRIAKEIEAIEFPRDDSMDNNIIVLLSSKFGDVGARASGGGSAAALSDDVVHKLCAKLEDMSFSVRRCSTPEECVEKSRELLLAGQLRCVVSDMGGRDKPQRCESCQNSMVNGGQDVYRHFSCNLCSSSKSGERWFCTQCHYDYCYDCRPKGGATRASETGGAPPHMEAVLDLLDSQSEFALVKQAELKSGSIQVDHRVGIWQGHGGVIPVGRAALLDTSFSLSETDRMRCWDDSLTVLSGLDEVEKWINQQPDWPSARQGRNGAGADAIDLTDFEDGEAVASAALADARGLASLTGDDATERLKKLRQAMTQCELYKAKMVSAAEATDRDAVEELTQRNAVFAETIRSRAYTLNKARDLLRAKVAEYVEGDVGAGTDSKHSEDAEEWQTYYNLPDSLAVDTAQVLARLDDNDDAEVSPALPWDVASLTVAAKTIDLELMALEEMALASKILALVPLHHKKLLNFTHDWLTTFLPHCLAKVNRVSFGLLTESECTNALKKEPNMPRSRLKLAVPFLGKDGT